MQEGQLYHQDQEPSWHESSASRKRNSPGSYAIATKGLWRVEKDKPLDPRGIPLSSSTNYAAHRRSAEKRSLSRWSECRMHTAQRTHQLVPESR